jgi:hypothetical protein
MARCASGACAEGRSTAVSAVCAGTAGRAGASRSCRRSIMTCCACAEERSAAARAVCACATAVTGRAGASRSCGCGVMACGARRARAEERFAAVCAVASAACRGGRAVERRRTACRARSVSSIEASRARAGDSTGTALGVMPAGFASPSAGQRHDVIPDATTGAQREGERPARMRIRTPRRRHVNLYGQAQECGSPGGYVGCGQGIQAPSRVLALRAAPSVEGTRGFTGLRAARAAVFDCFPAQLSQRGATRRLAAARTSAR